jgi:hypothetical protein
VDLETVADELYGLRPEDFTAARDERARAARGSGDRRLAARIAALRRPSLAAWASNLLVRGQRDQVEPLLRLGEALREAQEALDGERLRELTRQQRQLVTALARQAMRLAAGAGHPIGEPAQREVEQTLRAVLADPDAARAWATGRLTQPLAAPTGFALMGDTAVREPAPARRPPAKAPSKAPAGATPGPEPDDLDRRRRRRELTRARETAERARRELSAREQEHARAGRDLADAENRLAELDRRVADLSGRLEQAEHDHRTTRERARSLGRRVRETDRALRKAERQAADASGHLDRLSDRHHPDGSMNG